MGVPHRSPHAGSTARATSVCVWPSDEQVLVEAVAAAKCRIGRPEDADVLVSFNGDAELIRRWLRPGIRWVQLGSAGVDKWLDARVIDRDRVWTASQGVYAEPIAEHALALLLAAACDLPECIRVQRWSGAAWGGGGGRRLIGRTVGIIGCGGIGRALLALLSPFHVTTVAHTFSGRPVPGAAVCLAADDVDVLLERSDYVVIAAPLTPTTRNLISGSRFALMPKTSWLINVSRGGIVDTGALVSALETETIAGAALDVVEPEPLPADHPLWKFHNVVITPHTACSRERSLALFAARLSENLRRFQERRPLLGTIDVERGY